MPHPTTRTLAWLAVASSLVACKEDVPQAWAAPASASQPLPIEVRQPLKLTSIETHERDSLGRPVRIACTTCHSLKTTAPMPTSPADLDEFHQGLTFRHGSLACASCHVAEPESGPLLHLADGQRLPTSQALRLCAQCHGPQYRDFEKGAHGGLEGSWDDGAVRTKNHCVDCHDSHAPAIPKVIPAAPPRARDSAEGTPDHG
ncbi:MAG: hypothetical protein IPM79_06455 [Polyangiaceae bacterium]|nr:hypothetical protein [Polyangiaceae bacterium]MBK8937279.1 hypothetical protein [Polyangiaceae bacterium]